MADMNGARFQLTPGHIVLGEIANVITSMRQHPKWDTRAKMSASVHIRNLEFLRYQIESLSNRSIFHLEPKVYLQPFLDVITSEETNSTITAVALTSIDKFINCGFLGAETNNQAAAVCGIITSVAHCRFEISDSSTDEIVLMKVHHVLLACLQSPAGSSITNKLIYEMIQTCFRMSTQQKHSGLLRRSAEITLSQMVHCIFNRFRYELISSSNSKNVKEQLTSNESSSSSSSSPS
eukprot:TRINITY_DN6081_c1_g2_i1.p1 TRINITY_DN6081_c1_g2~~TRINITY_DN6081_c1_g2_i1.p1  ORF type:complete len:236 (+),score=34.85 TRINITY_DN6081_c1_g2_i1:3-710(+)